MSDRPLIEPTPAESPELSSSKRQRSSSNSERSSRNSEVSRWLTYASLAIAVIAVTFAALAYRHPSHDGAAGTAQQSGDAKANVCSAYGSAHKAVVINTHLQSPNPDVQLAIAANARLALIGGGSYLRDRLAANTAAPADLVNTAVSFANMVQQLGINYLNNAAPDVQNALRKDLDTKISQLEKFCA